MSESQQADSTAAREAAMSRVVTLDKLVGNAPEAPPKVETEEPKGDTEQAGEGHKAKKGINERITQLVERRRAAEEEAARAKAENDELKARLEALQVKADPIKEGDKPQRATFKSDEEYIEALADWKATQAIAARERAQAEAQAKAEFAEVTKAWESRIKDARKEITDFDQVVEAAEVQVSDVLGQALMRHEDGAELVYFLALHPDEARKLNRMNPIDAIRKLDRLSRELSEDEPKTEPKPTQRSKAPEPITPVRAASASDPAPTDFRTYRARREAERKK